MIELIAIGNSAVLANDFRFNCGESVFIALIGKRQRLYPQSRKRMVAVRRFRGDSSVRDFARVDPNRSVAGYTEKEFTLGANWFFNRHRNKLMLDLSHVIRRQSPETDTSNRARLQWDWSF